MEMNIFRFLAKIKLFEQLSFQEMSLFMPYMHERDYRQNEVVFLRSDPSHALYLLRKGEVTLSLDMEEGFEQLAIVRAGTVLGESCLLKKSKRQLNAIVTSEGASFYVVPQFNLFTIFESHLRIKAKMLESLGELYNEYNGNLFKSYKSSLGFFDLSQLYEKSKR